MKPTIGLWRPYRARQIDILAISVLVLCHLFSHSGRAFAQTIQLSSPPIRTISSNARDAQGQAATTELATDASLDRRVVLELYGAVVASEVPPMAWTGDITYCTPGDTSQLFKEAILKRINFYRTLAGVPPVTLNSDLNQKAQAAALMMSAESDLSHDPAPTWPCYSSDGALAAGSSNLSLGFSGPDVIDRYILDPGAHNFPVGHRRWVLFPYTLQMGTGDIPATGNLSSANALWNLGPTDPAATMRDGLVAWPPPGYVPYQIVYPRWSFSYPGADFSAASIVVSVNDEEVPLAILPIVNGFGLNTLVWEFDPGWAQQHASPQQDELYEIRIEGVLVDGIPQDFSYGVTVITGDQALSDIRFETSPSSTSASVFENQPIGAPVGSLIATDPQGGSPVVFSLVQGEGDDDNESFVIEQSVLRTNVALDYETKQEYSVRVQADNGRENGRAIQVLQIRVLDMPETPDLPNPPGTADSPIAILLTPNQIDENLEGATLIGTLSTLDADAARTMTTSDGYVFEFADEVGGQGREYFNIVSTANGPELYSLVGLDHEATSTVPVGIRVTDPEGMSYTQVVTIEVRDINEPPMIVTGLTTTFASPNQISTDSLSFHDPDVGDEVTVEVIEWPGYLTGVEVKGDEVVFTWAPNKDDLGIDDVEFLLTDKSELSTKYGFQILVEDDASIGDTSLLLPALFR